MEIFALNAVHFEGGDDVSDRAKLEEPEEAVELGFKTQGFFRVFVVFILNLEEEPLAVGLRCHKRWCGSEGGVRRGVCGAGFLQRRMWH